MKITQYTSHTVLIAYFYKGEGGLWCRFIWV